MVNGLFVCPIKAIGKKQSGNEASQFFFKLVLALLVRLAGAPTNTSADRSQYPIRAGVGWVSPRLARLPCLYASVNRLADCHATGCLFGKFVQLSSRSGCFCEPFSQLPNRSAWFIKGVRSVSDSPVIDA